MDSKQSVPNAKKWWQSKTIWFNAIASSLIIVEQNLPVLQTILPPNISVVLLVAVPVVNMVLRSVTTQGISK
jgi:hypothetical protein